MNNRASVWGVGMGAAIAAFALSHGVNEYLVALSSRTSTTVHGVEHALTPWELIITFLIGDTVQALPPGLVMVALLCIPLFFVTWCLRSAPAAVAYPFGCVIGALAGGVLSFGIYLKVGGWGPPYLFSDITAGAVLAVAFVRAFQSRNRA